MRGNGFLVVILVIVTLPSLNYTWRPFKIKKINVTAFSLNENIDVNASLAEDDAVSIYLNLKKNIDQPFARLEFYFDAGDGLFDLKYINETFNVCRFFRDRRYLPFVQMMYRFNVEKYQLPISCPIRKKSYAIENLKVSVEKFPPIMPEKQFFLGVHFFVKEGSIRKPLAVYKVFSKIVKV